MTLHVVPSFSRIGEENAFAELARVLRENAATDRCLLVDCLTLWLTNLLMLEDPARQPGQHRTGRQFDL